MSSMQIYPRVTFFRSEKEALGLEQTEWPLEHVPELVAQAENIAGQIERFDPRDLNAYYSLEEATRRQFARTALSRLDKTMDKIVTSGSDVKVEPLVLALQTRERGFLRAGIEQTGLPAPERYVRIAQVAHQFMLELVASPQESNEALV